VTPAVVLEDALALASLERWRAAASGARQPERPWKQWDHVVVLAGELQVLVNLCQQRDLRPCASRGKAVGALTLLVRERSWDGVVRWDLPVRSRPGVFGARVGTAQVQVQAGALRLQVEDRALGARIELRLAAEGLPLTSPAVPLGGGTFQWLALPCLRATGTVEWRGRRHRLRDAPAYHDENWGWWRWGEDFAWQWAYVPSNSGWVAVLSRMLDRRRAVEHDVRLLLWRDGALARSFQGREVSVTARGWFPERPAPARFPAIANLLAEGNVTDVPATLEITARRSNERVQLELTAAEVAQLAVPNETDLEVTWVNEVAVQARLDGSIAGERLGGGGPALLELVHGS